MLNHITIMGRLTRDPELRYTQSQKPVASFTVAVDRDFSNDGQKETDFIDCVAWNQRGEFVSKYFQKGSMIVVAGRLQSRRWQDKEGNNRISWEINADNTYFGGSKNDSQSGQQSSGYQNNSYAARQQRGAGVNVYADSFSEFDSFDEMPGPGADNPFTNKAADPGTQLGGFDQFESFGEDEGEGDGELPF